MNAIDLQSSRALGNTATDSLTISIDLDQSVFGPTPSHVVDAIREICGLRLPGDTFDSIHPAHFHDRAAEYYNKLRGGPNGEREALIFVAYVSTYFHELRHVHDLLATNYGQEVVFRIVNCAHNMPALLHGLGQWQSGAEGRLIHVPLGTNIDNMDGFPAELVNLVARYRKVLTDIEEYGRARSSSPSAVSIVHLLEGSAVEAQLSFINDVFGPVAVFELIRFIDEGGSGSTYLQIRDELIDQLITKEGSYDLGGSSGSSLSYLIWVALMGTTFKGRPFSDGPRSITLYEGLAQYLVQKQEHSFEQTRTAVDEFCDSWGLLRPIAVVGRRTVHLQEQAARAVQRSQELELDHDSNLGSILTSLSQAYEKLNDWILTSGRGYFEPIQYTVNVLLGRLPAVPLQLKVGGTFYDFVTSGYEIMPFDRWHDISTMATVFRLLVLGRGTRDANLWEDLCWRVVLKNPWGGIHLQIRENSPLFD